MSHPSNAQDHKAYEMREELDQASKVSDPLIANAATQSLPSKVVSASTLTLPAAWTVD